MGTYFKKTIKEAFKVVKAIQVSCIMKDQDESQTMVF